MSTSRKTAKKAAAPKTGSLAKKLAKQKEGLLDRLEELGLLDHADREKLEEKAHRLGESGGSLDEAALWDRTLVKSLGTSASAGETTPEKSWGALVAWQNGLASLPATESGLETAVGSLKQVIPFDGATLFSRDSDRSTVVPLVIVGFRVELISRIRFEEGQGFSSWVATRKKPVMYGSLHRNEAPDPDRVRSFITIPLVVGNECVGVLNLGHNRDGFYSTGSFQKAIVAGSMLAGLVQRFIAKAQIAAREIEDPASGLATERYLGRRLEEEVIRCQELGHSMSVATLRMVELEDLGGQYGSEFRSRCLADLAGVVRAWRQPTELVGQRDEGFVTVIFPSVRAERAEGRIRTLAQLLEKHNFPRRKRMSVSFGMAAYPADAEDAQGLLAAADNSKRDGARPPAEAPAPHSVAA